MQDAASWIQHLAWWILDPASFDLFRPFLYTYQNNIDLRRNLMFTVSENAAKEIQTLMTQYKNPKLALRVKIVAGGCSGFSYDLAFDDEIKQNDHTFESHGVKVIVDDRSLPHLEGTELD